MVPDTESEKSPLETRPLNLQKFNEKDFGNVPSSCHYCSVGIFFNLTCGIDLVGNFNRSMGIRRSMGVRRSSIDTV